MNLKAKEIPYSSVVGSSVSLVNEAGAVVALIMVSVPNPQFDYKLTAASIIDSTTPSLPCSTEGPVRRRDDIDDLCRTIAKMAERVGAKFVPDQRKIAALRAGRQKEGE